MRVEHAGGCRILCHAPVRASDIAMTLLPLSFNQQRLLFEEAIAQTCLQPSRAWNACLLHQLTGPVDGEALGQALHALVRRHAALRTAVWPAASPARRLSAMKTYFQTGRWPLNLYRHSVVDEVSVRLSLHALDGQARSMADGALGTLIDRDRLFDYSAPPLLRATLVQLNRDSHLVGIVVPHLVCDLWSQQVIIRDLVHLYGRAIGREPPIPLPVAPPYHEYVRTLHARVDTPAFVASSQYWRTQWDAFADTQVGYTELHPADVGAGGTDRTAVESLAFDPQTSNRIRARLRQTRCTLCTLVTAAGALELGRATARSRVAFWCHYSNRLETGMQDTVGWFNHSHLLGLDFSGRPTGIEVLRRARQTIFDGFAHHQFPVALLFHRFGHRWPSSEGTVAFDAIRRTATPVRVGDLVVTPSRVGLAPRLSLKITAVDTGSELCVEAAYAASRLDRTLICQLLAGIRATMLRLLDEPNEPVSDN